MIIEDQEKTVARRVNEIILSHFREEATPTTYRSKPLWKYVTDCGSELWLDTGDIEEASSLWCEEFSALTTNNTLINKEVQKGLYDELIESTADHLRGLVSEEDLPLEISFVLNAYHGLRLARQFGAKVSVELHTDIANDIAGTCAYARRLHEVAPEDFLVKVPFTPAGLLAAYRLSREGIPILSTMGFSARQNYFVASLVRPAFVTVVLGRLNFFVADNQLGSGAHVGEKATLASLEIVKRLRSEVGIKTREIAASMRDVCQIQALAGVDVLTIPPAIARGFEQLQTDSEAISSQRNIKTSSELSPDVDRDALGIDALWEVPAVFESTVRDLSKIDLSELTPDDLGEFFAKRGFPDLLPQWSRSDIEMISSDGKIPRYDHWKERLTRGEVALDSLMSISGLQSFVVDQAATDERIRLMTG